MRAVRVAVVLIALSPAACGLLAGFEDGYHRASDASVSTDVAAHEERGTDEASAPDAEAGDEAETGAPSLRHQSCAALPKTCGPTQSDDCCAMERVPGGTFNRANDPAYPATLSPFDLELFEVTVGRFRAFVDAGMGTQERPPPPGSGAHPKHPDSGWRAEWNAKLSKNTDRLKGMAYCGTYLRVFTPVAGPNETRPINCVSWYTAFAFCAWEGGRLPTQAEANFARAGGDEHRRYPWSDNAIDNSFASYKDPPPRECNGDGVDGCSFDDLVFVGSKPKGKGRWGHFELQGNVVEWNLDAEGELAVPCDDCLVRNLATNRRFQSGGGLFSLAPALDNAVASGNVDFVEEHWLGFRCAFDAR
jgi:formylglycine-generating enzyme required for sulfatase activity